MINFYPNFKINKINYNKEAKLYTRKMLNKDMFEHSCQTKNISFKGVNSLSSNQASASKFIKFSKEYNLLDKIPSILVEDNIIGHGNEHTVYAIPNNEEYVLRTPSSFDLSKIKNKELKIEATEDNLDINIGQKVGQIKVKNEFSATIEILKKQKGKPIGNPPPTAVFNEYTRKLRSGEIEYESPIRKEKFANSIKTLANLPISSYEKLIDDYKKAADAGYFFDHLNSNNLLVDEENQTICFIDMSKRKDKPNFGNLLSALTNSCYLDTYISNYDDYPVSNDEKNMAIKNTITIINKYLEAMKNKNETIDFDNMSMEFFAFMGSIPMSIVCNTWNIEEKKEFIKNKLNQV